MNEKNLKVSLIIIILIIAMVFILFFIGDVIIGGKGSNLCSIFFGCAMVILGLFYILVIILLKKFGTKVNAKIICYEGIRNNPYRNRCNIIYDIEGKSYTNWVIDENSDKLNENDEITVLVLKKYPKIVMSKYQNNLFMIIMMLILLIVGFLIIFSNIHNLF